MTVASALRGRLRRLRLGLATLLGAKAQGFFIPYRYAATVKPVGYPALEPLFVAATPNFRDAVAQIERWSEDLLRIRDAPGPARFDQDWFCRLDAAFAYATIRHHRPRRIVEVGSGHSTRFLARAVADGRLATDIVAIDPLPRAPLAELSIRHERRLLAEADPAIFTTLRAGDVLFVDSSHIAMPGTDVDLIVNDLLPRLPSGLLVHIHDIMLPDPYPLEWTWRGYNEQSLVGALLQGGGYEILFASHWVTSRHPEWLRDGVLSRLPLLEGARETSLWIRKR